MTTTKTDTMAAEPDVRTQHAEALACLETCRETVRRLNLATMHERVEYFETPRTERPVTVDGFGGRVTMKSATVGVHGSRRVDVQLDPLAAAEARLNMPQAIVALRHAEITEARLRTQVEVLDAAERRRERLARLPAVARAYAELDQLLVKADQARAAVRQAIDALGGQDAASMSSLAWPELDLLDTRRQMVATWTEQA